MKQSPSSIEVIVDTAGPSSPRVSVAVSTFNRAGHLARLFQHLARQTLRDDFELVIVDNGSTDDTQTTLAALAESSPVPVRAVRLSLNRGPAQGRNIAWQLARAAVVAFTDDDCAPQPGWLENGLRSIELDNIVVGCTVPDPGVPQGPFSRTVHHRDVAWIPTCNVFYWRDDLVAVGGFDESFDQVGGEDTDLGLRVCKSLTRRLRYCESAVVFHDVRASRFLDALRETQRWSDTPRLFKRHPEARQWLTHGLYWAPAHPKAILAAVGLLVGPAIPPALVLTVPWLRFRAHERRITSSRRRAYLALPGMFVIDLAEVLAMLRGSVRHRTLVL